MSKRVSNKKGRSRTNPARSGVRLGWHAKRVAGIRYRLIGRLQRGESHITVQPDGKNTEYKT